MAFGINPRSQELGDVLVSSSLLPYDNRVIGPAPHFLFQRTHLRRRTGYVVDYSQVTQQPARVELISLFVREKMRGGHPFGIHVGAMLSGAARIHSGQFRDELAQGVPSGDDPIVGGEMEGVGLLAASVAAADPIWCVVKGISDFADENRDRVIGEYRLQACRNSAQFVLSALVNDTAG